jgi:hypothetical protein
MLNLNLMPSPKLLTIKLDPETYYEFAAASTILRERTMSALIFRFVISKIKEAQGEVSAAEFARIKANHKADIDARSKLRTKTKGVPTKTVHLAQPKKRRHG